MNIENMSSDKIKRIMRESKKEKRSFSIEVNKMYKEKYILNKRIWRCWKELNERYNMGEV